jgi:phage-related protein
MAQAELTSTTSAEGRKSASLTYADEGYKMREIVTAMDAVANLIEDSDPAIRPNGEAIAAILRTFACAIDGVRLPTMRLQ